jgi:hypothetical protein
VRAAAVVGEAAVEAVVRASSAFPSPADMVVVAVLVQPSAACPVPPRPVRLQDSRSLQGRLAHRHVAAPLAELRHLVPLRAALWHLRPPALRHRRCRSERRKDWALQALRERLRPLQPVPREREPELELELASA